MTRAGVILGPAAYMSPEQAKGKVVDKRSDIWAFGCIVSGKQATSSACLRGASDLRLWCDGSAQLVSVGSGFQFAGSSS